MTRRRHNLEMALNAPLIIADVEKFIGDILGNPQHECKDSAFFVAQSEAWIREFIMAPLFLLHRSANYRETPDMSRECLDSKAHKLYSLVLEKRQVRAFKLRLLPSFANFCCHSSN